LSKPAPVISSGIARRNRWGDALDGTKAAMFAANTQAERHLQQLQVLSPECVLLKIRSTQILGSTEAPERCMAYHFAVSNERSLFVGSTFNTRSLIAITIT